MFSASFSPDGQRIVSGSFDKTLKIWDARTGAEVLTLRGHTDPVVSASFSPDGQRLISASTDKTLKIWDARTGTEVLTLRGHMAPVFSASFSLDGQRIVSGSSDETLKVWDARTGAEVLTLRGHNTGGNSLASFSPDGERVVSASGDTTVKVWDARTGKEVLTLRGHTSQVKSASFSPDGQRIVSASDDKTVKIWDARPVAKVLTVRGHTNWVSWASYSPDGQRIVSFDRGGVVKVWNAETGRELNENPPEKLGGLGGRHPKLPRMAIPLGTTIRIVDIGPPSEDERLYREGMARFDPVWHREQPALADPNVPGGAFARVFHMGQIALHIPANARNWQQLIHAADTADRIDLAVNIADRAIAAAPNIDEPYRARAQLRARYFQFHAASADELVALVLRQRAASDKSEAGKGAKDAN